MTAEITYGIAAKKRANLLIGFALLFAQLFVFQFANARITLDGHNSESVGSEDVFAGLTVINPDELNGIRGGFRIGGLEINIGAIVRTFIDGRQALESQLTVSGSGIVTSSITSPASPEIPGLTVIPGDGSGPALREVTPKGIELDGLEGSQGIVVNDARGFAAALQTIRNDRFLSTLINRSSGRRIRHEVDIGVTVRGFQPLQQSVRGARLANRISNSIR